MERSISTVCSSRRLLNTPRKNSSLLCIGTTTSSASSSVRVYRQLPYQRELSNYLVRPGKGLHNEDGVSKLRPALEGLFDEYVGYFYTDAVLSTHARCV
jgi:hypothetical protein